VHYPGNEEHILVVDDDRQIARLVRSYLEQAGYRVWIAYDGDEALRSVRSEKPDLIVLDLMLPGRDGWEITRIIRSDPTQRTYNYKFHKYFLEDSHVSD